MIPQMLCNVCENYKGGGKCNAFEKIPSFVLSGKNKHFGLIEGQTGAFIFTIKHTKLRTWKR